MSRAGEIDVTIYHGDTLEITHTFLDSAGDPIDMSGYAFAGEVRLTPEAEDPLGTFDFDDSQAVDGIISATIEFAVTETWPRDVPYVAYDMEHTADGVKTTFRAGRVILRPDVTRP